MNNFALIYLQSFFAIIQCYASSVKFFDCDNFTVALSRVETVTSDNGKSLVWEEKIVGAATIVADSRV